ncbi:MAG: hypothetical protein NC346_02475 [Prevotella sp.]|nr:hypothetical protein [Bacteroidales bacterium]MCM1068739.1 hypothetical protein [Prevotella sp.]MCM1577162.1 hypothetical protein [Bacteroides sp.]
MAWTELRERDDYGTHPLKKKLRKVKELMEDICEDLEDDFSERDSMYEREMDGLGERRGVRGTGRYSRYR